LGFCKHLMEGSPRLGGEHGVRGIVPRGAARGRGRGMRGGDRGHLIRLDRALRTTLAARSRAESGM